MELNHSGMIYFALKEESNQVVHISEMVEKDRGKACECICLCCGRPLVAKLGRGKKAAHFAHLAEEGRTSCSADAANESGLHKIAKEIVCKSHYGLEKRLNFTIKTPKQKCRLRDSSPMFAFFESEKISLLRLP